MVNNAESLLDYGSIGPRYSNLTLQGLLVLKGGKLLVLVTLSKSKQLQEKILIM